MVRSSVWLKDKVLEDRVGHEAGENMGARPQRESIWLLV